MPSASKRSCSANLSVVEALELIFRDDEESEIDRELDYESGFTR